MNSTFCPSLLAISEVISQVNINHYSHPSSPRKTKWLPVSLRLVFEEEILSTNEEEVPKNTNMVTKFGVTVFNGKLFNLSNLIF